MKRRHFVSSSILLGAALVSTPTSIFASFSFSYRTMIPSLSKTFSSLSRRPKQQWTENFKIGMASLNKKLNGQGYFLLENQLLNCDNNIYLCPVKSLGKGHGMLFIEEKAKGLSHYLITPDMMPAYRSFISDIKEYYPADSQPGINEKYFFPVQIRNAEKENYFINYSGDKISIIKKAKDHYIKISK